MQTYPATITVTKTKVEFTPIGSGLYQVFVDGVQVSEHITKEDALDAAKILSTPGNLVKVTHDYEVDVATITVVTPSLAVTNPPSPELDYPDHWAGITEGAGDAVGTGTTYYVATTGSDAAAGTEGAPWLTPGKASGSVVAGDTVIFEDGTYTLGASSQLRIATQGTVLEPITFKARNARAATIHKPTTGDEATIQMGIFSSGWEKNNDFYWVLDGLTITGGVNHALAVTGSNHVTVKNCDLGFSGHDPIKNNSSSNYNLYYNNKIHDSNQVGPINAEGVDCTSSSYVILRNNNIFNINEGAGFYFKKASQFCLAEYNLVFDVADKFGGGVGESQTCYESVIRHNIFETIGLAGVSARGAKGCVIHNNTCYDSGGVSSTGGCWRAAAADESSPTTDNDVFVDNGFNTASLLTEDLIVRDNILVVNRVSAAGYMNDTGSTTFEGATEAIQIAELTTKNNLYYNRGSSGTYIYNWKNTDYTSLGSWQSNTATIGNEQDLNSVQGDPTFTSVARGNANYMKLTAGSPAINAASDGNDIGTSFIIAHGVDW